MSYALGAKATMLACSVGQVDHGIRQLNFLSESKLRFNRLHPFNQANMQQLHTAYFLSHCCWAAYWAYTNHDLALGCIGSLQMLPSYSLQPPLVYKCVRWFSPCNSKNQQCAGTPGVQYLTHTETLPYACMSSEECFPEQSVAPDITTALHQRGMGPKKVQSRQRARRGILGACVYDSDDDSDFTPGASSQGKPKRGRSKAGSRYSTSI